MPSLTFYSLPRTPWTLSTAAPTTGGTSGSPSTPGGRAAVGTMTGGGAGAGAGPGPGTGTGGPGQGVTVATGGGPGLGPGLGPGPGTGERGATAGTGETPGERGAPPGTGEDLDLRAAVDLAECEIFLKTFFLLKLTMSTNLYQ